MFGNILEGLPEEIIQLIFKFVGDTAIRKLVGECSQIMKYYNSIMSRGYDKHRLNLKKTLEEWNDTISYTINEELGHSKYKYKYYISKLPGVLNAIGSPYNERIPTYCDNMFSVYYEYLAESDVDRFKYHSYVVITTFKVIKINHDLIMWHYDNVDLDGMIIRFPGSCMTMSFFGVQVYYCGRSFMLKEKDGKIYLHIMMNMMKIKYRNILKNT
jgi:hypothetical protein